MTHVPARLRLGLTAAVAAALAVGGTTAAAGAPSSAERDGAGLKTRAINALLASAEGSSTAAAKAPSADRSATRLAASDAPTTGERASGPRTAPDTAADVGDCTALGLDWTPTHDRVWLHWEDMGLPSYTLYRKRDGGAWQRLGSTTKTSFQDTRTSTRTFSQYRLDASGLSCVMDGWVTMVTPDGRGEVDVLFGAAKDGFPPQLLEQDAYSWAVSTTLGGGDPAFSPDGRFVASANFDAGSSWNLSVNAVGGARRHVTTVGMPTGIAAAEPAWSPDGRSIAYTRYTVDQAGEATGSVLHVLDLTTGTDRVVTGSEGMIQADWRSATTLVAAGFAPGTGLYNVPVAGGTPVAIADTQNAGYPEVAPDGRIWFTEGDGTTFHVRAVVPQANDQVGTVQTSTTHFYERPRVAPDGTVYVVDVDMHDVTNPDDNTFTVIRGSFGPDGMQETAIGAPLDQSLTGFYGYDVRQPLGTGTSSFVGDANPDVLARDSSGHQWLYPLTQDPDTGAPTFGSRALLGTGWQIYTTTIAAGDLTGDGRGDIVARDSSGRLYRYDGKGAGKVAPRVQIGSGWNGYYILSTGDFNGDSRADLMARDSSGRLWLYPGNGRGGLSTKVQVGSGWQGFTSITGTGDFDYDNDADVLARDSSGRLWLYPGTGGGTFATKRQVGSGWNVFNAVLGPENVGSLLNVLGRDKYGNLVAYGIIGDGRFDSALVGKIGTGWNAYAITS